MAARHHVVIVGGGFGGQNAARALGRAPVRVTLIDRRNFHLFQPLLYQVATGGLSPADITAPIRALLRRQGNAQVLLAEVESVEVADRRVRLSDGQVIEYDTLVLAAGAGPTYFGRDEWAERAPALKTVEDATEIRGRTLFAFEAAERVSNEDARRAWLTFVIIGGGPTGVELAGAIGELARSTLKRNFRSFDPAQARVFLLEGGENVLPTYDERLRGSAVSSLGRLGVTVRTRAMVEDVDERGVETKTDGEVQRIDARTVIWAAGVQAVSASSLTTIAWWPMPACSCRPPWPGTSRLGREVARAAGVEVDGGGRVVVEPDLTVPGHPEIFVIGDLAYSSHQTGFPLRGTADVALAQGTYVGRAIGRRLAGKAVNPFRFRDLGTLAVIGRSAAVADLRFVRLKGGWRGGSGSSSTCSCWWAYQNRLTVMVQWGWSYFTRNRSARLITGELHSPFDEGGGR